MARKLHVSELSTDGFAAYGSFAPLLEPKGVCIGAEPIEFFRDMVLLDLGAAHHAAFSVCRVSPRPEIIDVTEYHTSCGEASVPLDGDVAIHVGPATPNGILPLDDFELFRVPRGTLVVLHPGVWHHAAFALGEDPVNVLVVLPERTYANDCIVCELPERDRIRVSL